MRSPIVGGWGVARSTNAADSELYNLFPEFHDVQDSGKGPSWLQMAPGLRLVTTVGGGPIRGLHSFGSLLYVISGTEAYSMSASGTIVDLGPVAAGPNVVPMIDNSFQMVILDGTGMWLVPGGNPLSGGTIGSGGANYIVNDVIRLKPGSGVANATPILKVTTVSAGAVTAFSILQAGAISTTPANFSQLSTSGSGSGFTLTLSTYGAAIKLVPIYLPIPVPTTGDVVDGFGLVAQAGTGQINQSQFLDLSIWDPLNFALTEQHTQSSDVIQALAAIHDELFVIKTYSTEVWINAGTPGFAFQPLTGVHLELGTIASASVAKAGENLLWLSRNEQGEGIVVQVEGYAPRSVSTQAQVAEFTSYSNLGDAQAYAYQQAGHVFYVLIFPTASKTWVLDVVASVMGRAPLWHRRATWNGSVWSAHPALAFARFIQSLAAGIGCLGDSSGKLYTYDLTQLTDNGATRRWLRSWRGLPTPREQTTRYNALRIDMQTGSSAGTVTLRWSDDGGNTWTTGSYTSAVNPLNTSVKFLRLGSTRHFAFSDRIFELSSASAFPVAIIGAEVEIGEAQEAVA